MVWSSSSFVLWPQIDIGGNHRILGSFKWTVVEADPGWPNSAADQKRDVQGCCWWGLGIIQTTGVCNFGKLNYYLGQSSKVGSTLQETGHALYKDINFCLRPDKICSTVSDGNGQCVPEHASIKWVAGLFFWMESVQTYETGETSHHYKDGYSYITELRKYVNANILGAKGGMYQTGGTSDAPINDGKVPTQEGLFIHSASGIVNRGCPDPPCGDPGGGVGGELDGPEDRADNFIKVLKAMKLK